MDKLLVESIVNSIFTVSGLDFQTEYSRFYKEGTAVINAEMRQWEQRVLSEFKSALDNAYNIHDIRLESIPRTKREGLSFEEGKAYCQGWNDSTAEHQERVADVKEIAIRMLTLIFEKYSTNKQIAI